MKVAKKASRPHLPKPEMLTVDSGTSGSLNSIASKLRSGYRTAMLSQNVSVAPNAEEWCRKT